MKVVCENTPRSASIMKLHRKGSYYEHKTIAIDVEEVEAENRPWNERSIWTASDVESDEI